MEYIYGTKQIKQTNKSVVVLGNFDGIHLGHQKLFSVAKEKARSEELQVVALSFYPHPTWVLGHHPKPLIMSRKDRKEKMQTLGIDVFIEYPFSVEFANTPPEYFFKEILIDQLNAKSVVVGSNYYFGKGKKGNAEDLKILGEKYGVHIYAVETIEKDGQVVSSTSIREFITEGKMEKATSFLGHPYSIIGTVIHGKKLGRTLGFPTINIIADPERVYPPNGVYATTVIIEGSTYKGITNIGYNPTVNGKIKMIETHIFDLNEDLYGQEVKVIFHGFIRQEKKFEGVDELKAQIQEDKQVANKLLKTAIDSLQA